MSKYTKVSFRHKTGTVTVEDVTIRKNLCNFVTDVCESPFDTVVYGESDDVAYQTMIDVLAQKKKELEMIIENIDNGIRVLSGHKFINQFKLDEIESTMGGEE